MNTIYVFCNGCHAQDWHNATALSDEGLFLGGHVCSDHGFIPGDMGADGSKDWARKRDAYARAYPDGFEVVYVEGPVKEHAGIMAAHAKHKAFDEAAYRARMEQIYPEPVAAKEERRG